MVTKLKSKLKQMDDLTVACSYFCNNTESYCGVASEMANISCCVERFKGCVEEH